MAMNLQSGGGGRRRGARGSRRTPMAEINVTPLVDVMLVLLIIFMVTAPLLQNGVPLRLPDSKANSVDPGTEPIEISVDAEGNVYIGSERISDVDMSARFAALAGAMDPNEPRIVMLRGDRNIDYGRLMQVMGELNRAGLSRVTLVTVG